MIAPMTMENLYHEMKEALEYFGLSFHQMSEVKVFSGKNGFIFQHEGKQIRFSILGPEAVVAGGIR